MQTVSPRSAEQQSEVEEVLELFGGDAHKALSLILSDCHHLHEQLTLTSGAMSVGFTRGWLPKERVTLTGTDQSDT